MSVTCRRRTKRDLRNSVNSFRVALISRHHCDAISDTSADVKKQWEHLAKNDPNLNLHAIELPQCEKATRDAVTKTEEHELLFSSGREFEFKLLLTQAESLSYGWHLANIAETSSSSEEV